jgi:hypothetical protein
MTNSKNRGFPDKHYLLLSDNILQCCRSSDLHQLFISTRMLKTMFGNHYMFIKCWKTTFLIHSLYPPLMQNPANDSAFHTVTMFLTNLNPFICSASVLTPTSGIAIHPCNDVCRFFVSDCHECSDVGGIIRAG